MVFLHYNRYIFYDVNPGEGFNLRRDVFMRIAVMVKKLNQESSENSYTLVSFVHPELATVRMISDRQIIRYTFC